MSIEENTFDGSLNKTLKYLNCVIENSKLVDRNGTDENTLYKKDINKLFEILRTKLRLAELE